MLVNLHLMDLARQYTTRMIGLRAGEVVYDGPASSATDADFEAIYGRRSRRATPSGRDVTQLPIPPRPRTWPRVAPIVGGGRRDHRRHDAAGSRAASYIDLRRHRRNWG